MDLHDTLETSHLLSGDGVKQLPSYQRHGALLQLLLVLDLDIRDGNVLVLAKHTDRGRAMSQLKEETQPVMVTAAGSSDI